MPRTSNPPTPASPSRCEIARAFARDCATLMEVDLHELSGDDFRAMARRYVDRTLDVRLRRAEGAARREDKAARIAEVKADNAEATRRRMNAREARRQRKFLKPIPNAKWNPLWPPLSKVTSELGRLRAFLLAEILPRLDRPYETASGADVEPHEGYAKRQDDAKGLEAERFASPFAFVGGSIDFRNALFECEPSLAVHGLFQTLNYAPWGRCKRCRRVFACGRLGRKFCGAICRVRQANSDRKTNPKPERAAEALNRKRKASQRVLRIYHEKKNNEFVRVRNPGAGRPRKPKE